VEIAVMRNQSFYLKPKIVVLIERQTRLSEEPDSGSVSSPVLKTSLNGDIEAEFNW